jgi:hypothetical protein
LLFWFSSKKACTGEYISKNGERIKQVAKSGRDVTQVGGSTNKTVTVSANLFIGIFLIGVIAFGGLFWAFTAGLNQGGQIPQTFQKPETK